MRSSFARDLVLYLLKACFVMMAFFLPLILSTWLIDLYSLGPVARFNLFALSLILSMLILFIVSRLRPLWLADMPSFELKHAHWETAMDIIAWLKRHDTLSFSLAMLGLVVYTIPLNVAWLWLLSLHIFVSTPSVIALFFVTIMISFLVPGLIISIIYTSIIKPKTVSVKQMDRIIETIYSSRQFTGEMLERSKRTIIREPTKRMKMMLIPIVAVMITADVIFQLVEMHFIPERTIVYVPALILPCLLLILPMFFMGKKRTELDAMWNEEPNRKPLLSTKNPDTATTRQE